MNECIEYWQIHLDVVRDKYGESCVELIKLYDNYYTEHIMPDFDW